MVKMKIWTSGQDRKGQVENIVFDVGVQLLSETFLVFRRAAQKHLLHEDRIN